MIQVQVSIGRNNASGIPLPKIAWYNFQRDVSYAIWADTRGGSRWVETHKGEGIWGEVREESAHITMLDVFWVDSDHLRLVLASVAKRYGQSAVALSITEPELIAAV